MPSWLITVLAGLGVPALKLVLVLLEGKYPGLAPLIDSILKFLNGGGSASAVQDHCTKLAGFCPQDLK